MDDEADRFASRARSLRLEPLPIDSAEAERLAARLRDEWRRSPVLGTTIPTPLADEMGAIERALDVLQQYVPTLVTPEDAAKFIREHKAELQRYSAGKRRERAAAIVLLRATLPKLDSAIRQLRDDPFNTGSLAELDDLGSTFRLVWAMWHWASNPEEDSFRLESIPPSEVDAALERLGWSFGTGDPPCAFDPEDLDRIEQAAADVKLCVSRLSRTDKQPIYIRPAIVRDADAGSVPIHGEVDECPESGDVALPDAPPVVDERDSGTEARPDPDDAYISFKEAAAQTGMKAYELTRACNSGNVRCMGKGQGRRIHSADLARFVTRRQQSD